MRREAENDIFKFGWVTRINIATGEAGE